MDRLITRKECNKRISQLEIIKHKSDDINQLDRILKKLFREEKNDE